MSKQIFTHNKIESLRSKGNGSKCSSKVLNNFLLKFLYINKNSAIICKEQCVFVKFEKSLVLSLREVTLMHYTQKLQRHN